jgi:hypothetical protein
MVVDGAQTGHHDIADRIRPLMQRANVDRIYYCHGFASNFDSNKDKVRVLSAAAIVDGNTVDYTLSPHKVFESFQKSMSARRNYLFVGTSMASLPPGLELNLAFHMWPSTRLLPLHIRSKNIGSIRISYALPDGIEQKVNAGGAHGPSRLSGLAV